MSKSGFSTLHRWLGRRSKDKSMTNGKLSKSNTNLSISSTNINETSQLEYNRITPLPAATTNAPFEQTFRITVLLPKDQLYVTRLGARVPLSKLLELVCDNKLLDPEKYEFRNPVDASQVYSCDLTIGAVGLSEIRLCHKSESYDNFNTDEIIKLHRTSLIRGSLSSSEFSSHNSKHTTKTTSPYSSTNSLNSMDSSAISYGRTSKLSTSLQPKMSAPPRKKRAAPRPPSQVAIPEKSTLIMENDLEQDALKCSQESSLTTKDFSVSTPNLTSSTMLHSDINGNNCNGHMEDYNENSSGNGSLNSNGYSEDTVLYAQVQKKNALNLHSQSKQDVSDSIDNCSKFPEPSPRKRIVQIKKKMAAPPAPPPRSSLYQEDTVSIASTNVSTSSAPTTPVCLANSTGNFVNPLEEQPTLLEEKEPNNEDNIPKPVPRITTNSTSTTLLNATNLEQDLESYKNTNDTSKMKPNISKVLLNRTPTPEPRSLSCEPPEVEASYETQVDHFKQQKSEDDCVSKQADSGIGEPVPSPLPDSLPSEVSTLDVKSNFESSSDDDDMVKVYNFKLGKTLLKPLNETKTLEELTIMNNVQEETDSEVATSLTLTQVPTPNTLSESSSWNFAIPISPPPNFADNKCMENLETESKSDTPITPKIMERPVLNFENLKKVHEGPQELQEKIIKATLEGKSLKTPTTPLDNIVDELSAIIQDKGLDTLIKKSEESQEIEAAKPNTLSNFCINSISQSNMVKPKEVLNENSNSNSLSTSTDKNSPKETCSQTSGSSTLEQTSKAPSSINSLPSISDEEKLYRKRSSITSLKQRKSITRSDSFHTTASTLETSSLNKRTSSQLSLDQMTGNLNRRRSSSELSIGESPSLQSLEVIKTILNSRKNSLANSSGAEEQHIEVNARSPSNELKFTSLELKSVKTNEKNNKYEQKEEQDKQDVIPTKERTEEQKPKEVPKIYRYSGPPCINFSTWNERPKVQVAIKNEGDYIFGGSKTNTNTRNYRISTPASTSEPPPMAPKPATIQRMGIPEREYKVPIIVKPLQDVVIDNIIQKEETKQSERFQQKLQMNGERPTVKAVLRPQTQGLVNINTNSLPKQPQRPTVEEVLRPQTQIIVNTSTLPRQNKQRFSVPATIPGPQLLRSSSIKQQEPTKPSSTSVEVHQVPFGQNTLRRTGLKEKILAKEEMQTTATAASTTTANQKSITNGDLKFTHNTITSAKLHLNLKKTTPNTTTINLHQGSKTATPSNIISSTALKAKPQTLKTAPVLATNCNIYSNAVSITTATATTPTPPTPPPLATMTTTIQLKPVTAVHTPLSASDPRDELLAAIRNFKKQDLKKA